MIRRKKRNLPELDMTSTADISFMLLIFFLVASSMDIDKGIARLLPPSNDEKQQEMQVEKEQLIALTITAGNELLLNDKPVEMKELQSQISSMIATIGAGHMISIDADPASHYNTYFELQNEITAAYRTVRNQIARRQYGKDYAHLDEVQRETVRTECPQRIADVIKAN